MSIINKSYHNFHGSDHCFCRQGMTHLHPLQSLPQGCILILKFNFKLTQNGHMFDFFSLSLSMAIVGKPQPQISLSASLCLLKLKPLALLLQVQACSQILELEPSRGRSMETATLPLPKNSHQFVMSTGPVLTWSSVKQ